MAPVEGERSSQPLSADASDEENRNDSTRESSEATTWYYRMEEEEDEDEEDPDYEDEPDEEDEDDFRGVNDREIEILMENGGDDDEDEEDEDEIQGVTDEQRLFNIVRTGARTGLLTRRQLIALMQSPDLTSVLFQDNPREDAEFLNNWPFNRSLTPKDPDRFPKVPSEQGLKLMRSGAFGANDYNPRAKRPLAVRMLERELALGNREDRIRNNALINQSLLPKSRAEKIIHFDDPVYSGQFSDDGNFFFACSQDFKVRMYDTSSPYNWKHYKTVSYPWGQWTLTDASLSPDNKWLAYTSIQSMVSIAPTDPNDTGDPYTLDLDNSPLQGYHRRGFGIWSVRFSGDGRELVAGTSAASIVVYDIESRTVLHHVRGHSDDVNAVCFADKMSPHILYSGSDDTTIKVWDRRSMGDHREAGAFVGHIEGLTYIDSKGDGRYILSNGKDQSMKLWDIRMAMSTDRFNELDPTAHANTSGFDYRGGIYDDEDWDVHPHDNSLVTFRGHKVLRTLIRCHFSPPMSTNSRYVYSGSTDGKVYIWNMDASLAGIIDVKKATMRTRPMDNRRRAYHSDEPSNWRTCVRDASWHPTAPLLVASAWNGYNMARGTCTLHSYNDNVDDEGEPPMGQSVNNLLKEQPELYQNSTYTNGLLLG